MGSLAFKIRKLNDPVINSKLRLSAQSLIFPLKIYNLSISNY